jgi:hypothetical protein
MSGICSTHGGGNSLRGWIMLNWILSKLGVQIWTGLIYIVQRWALVTTVMNLLVPQ